MAVLLAVNEALLSVEVPSEEDVEEIVERVVAKVKSDSDTNLLEED